MIPGKMVYELRPAVDWNKGKAVLHLIDVLGLDSDDIVPMYLATTSPTRTRSPPSATPESRFSWAAPMIPR